MSPALAGRFFTANTTWEAHHLGSPDSSEAVLMKHVLCTLVYKNKTLDELFTIARGLISWICL